jgi:hypothetical protein
MGRSVGGGGDFPKWTLSTLVVRGGQPSRGKRPLYTFVGTNISSSFLRGPLITYCTNSRLSFTASHNGRGLILSLSFILTQSNKHFTRPPL